MLAGTLWVTSLAWVRRNYFEVGRAPERRTHPACRDRVFC